MKFISSLFVLTFLFFTNPDTRTITSESVLQVKLENSFLVTFECNSCTKRNQFYISGPEEHTFKSAEFPLKIKLQAGEYEMTYWQNRVQQIHLPFDVSSDSNNIISVKD